MGEDKQVPQRDVVIIGAGVCGIYMLYRMKELGMDAVVLERGSGPGGTACRCHIHQRQRSRHRSVCCLTQMVPDLADSSLA